MFTQCNQNLLKNAEISCLTCFWCQSSWCKEWRTAGLKRSLSSISKSVHPNKQCLLDSFTAINHLSNGGRRPLPSLTRRNSGSFLELCRLGPNSLSLCRSSANKQWRQCFLRRFCTRRAHPKTNVPLIGKPFPPLLFKHRCWFCRKLPPLPPAIALF